MNRDSTVEMVSAGSPKVVLDPYEWLPAHGETTVFIRCEGLELVVEFSYDDESGDSTTVRRRAIRFGGVCAFDVAAFPGADLMRIRHSGMTASGSVVEYTDSEAARMWQQSLGHRPRLIRHYQVFLLAENRRLEVFAEECSLSAETD